MQVELGPQLKSTTRRPRHLSLLDLATNFDLDEKTLRERLQTSGIQPSTYRGQVYLSPSEARRTLGTLGHKFPEKAQRISMMMCKGGVGKTTVSFFLSERLSNYGARVLVVDTDPQGNLTAALCRAHGLTEISESTPVLMDVLDRHCTIQQAIKPLTSHLHLIPSTALNSLLDKKLSKASSMPVFELHRHLSEIDSNYDYVVIDSAPALNLINASIMYASDRIIMPLFMYEFSLMGLKQTLSELKDCQKSFKFTTRVNVLVNKFDHREKWSLGYMGQLAQEYRHLIFNSVIHSNAQLQKCLATGTSIFWINKSSAKDDFDSLAREVLTLAKTPYE